MVEGVLDGSYVSGSVQSPFRRVEISLTNVLCLLRILPRDCRKHRYEYT